MERTCIKLSEMFSAAPKKLGPQTFASFCLRKVPLMATLLFI